MRFLLGLPVLVALAVGLYAGPTMPWADAAPGEGSVEVGFSRDMQAHHAQAVSMAGLAFDRSRHAEVRAIAFDVVTTQANQIGQMAGWLEEWDVAARGTDQRMAWMTDLDGGADVDGTGPGGHAAGGHVAGGVMPGTATRQQLAALGAARGPAFDAMFLDLLAEHHRGGLGMLEAAVAGTDRSSVRELAANMLASQQAELDVLAELGTRVGR